MKLLKISREWLLAKGAKCIGGGDWEEWWFLNGHVWVVDRTFLTVNDIQPERHMHLVQYLREAGKI